MTALTIILIISNLAFSLSVAYILIAAVVDSRRTKAKDIERSKMLGEALRNVNDELLFVLQRNEITYKGKIFEVEEVYCANEGETKLRLKDKLGFTLCVSIKDVTISEKQTTKIK